MENLTDKKKRFCEEYIIDLNATQAAIRAGYSKKTANEQASRLLANVNIQQYIASLQEERSGRTQITADKVLKELAKVGFTNINNYINDDFTIKELSEIDDEQAAAIQKIEVETSINGSEKVKFWLYNKLDALEKIARHLGMFTDKSNVTGEVKITIVRDGNNS